MVIHTIAKADQQHISMVSAMLSREIILPIGALVATRNALGYTRVGTISSYGYGSTLQDEWTGTKKYTIVGMDTAELGVVERSEDEIMVIWTEEE